MRFKYKCGHYGTHIRNASIQWITRYVKIIKSLLCPTCSEK